MQRESRRYESEAIRSIRASWKTRQRVLLVLIMGAGKTVIASDIITQDVRSGKRAIFVVHLRELVQQAVDRLVESGCDREQIGVIQGGRVANPERPIQVASIQALSRRGKYPRADIVVLDEAHHATAAQWLRALSFYPDAKVLGLTATPVRLDGKPLGDLFEDMIEAEKTSKLVADGYVAAPGCFVPPKQKAVNLKGVRTQGGDYNLAQLARRMNRRELFGDAFEHYKEHAGNRRAIAYCVNRAHAAATCRYFRERGVAAEYLDGETPVLERRAILERLKTGETRVVFNCMVLAEGFDAPWVKCVLLMRPTKSLALYLQQAGRVMRPYKPTSGSFKGLAQRPLVLDHAGNMKRHDAYPHADQPWSLTAAPPKPKMSMPPTVSFCPECGYQRAPSARACEQCGLVFPIVELKTKGGKLIEVNAPSDDEVRAFAEDICAKMTKEIGKDRARAFARKAAEFKYGRLVDNA